MLSSPEKIIFIFVILLTFFLFSLPVYHRFLIIKSGLPERRFNKPLRRIWNALSKVLFQRCTLKNERVITGIAHLSIFYGALTFDTMTINHTLEGFIPNFFLFGQTNFGFVFSFLVDTFSLLVIAGVIFFAVKRYLIRPKAYATTPLDSGIIYIFLTIVTLSYLYFECFTLVLHPDTERWAFLGSLLAHSVKSISLNSAAVAAHFKISWWLHSFFVYAFIAYVPHSKYFHMFAGSLNLLFNPQKPLGELKSLDIENSEIFGIEKAFDFTWKDLFDTFACMECGRCQDACPAFSSDKPLSPKMIILNLKYHLLKERKKLKEKRREDLPPLISGVFTEEEIWACTTCGACMHVCPVEIEHIPKLIGVRQSQVLMESKFPSELNTFFRNIETNSNPWGIGFAERAKWIDDLDVKIMNENPNTDYLFWVGCAGSFDEEGKKITKSMISLLNKAQINYAILGIEEKCCGDSAKRLGNEYLFQMQAAENINLFKKYNVKKIIVTCPHGYNTFKNEYPGLIDLLPDLCTKEKEELKKIQVIHHTQFIWDLIQKEKLSIKPKINNLLTYHDSCYLGRHNKIIDAPRNLLNLLSTNRLTELKKNKEHSFCCGAGGGLMWTDETQGKRINHLRTEEVIASHANIVGTSCPFCMTMLQDGLKDKGKDEIQVKDIAQLVEESLDE